MAAKQLLFDETSSAENPPAASSSSCAPSKSPSGPKGRQCRHRQEIRLADRHQGRRDRRQGDRARGHVREHGRADGAAKSPARPPTSPATAPPPPPCSPRRIYREGVKTVAAGANPMDLKRGIDKAVEAGRRRARKRLQEGHRPRGDRARSAPSRPTGDDDDRRHHRRGHGQGRQGRRHHRRRGQGHRDHRSTSSKACSSTAATSRPTSSPTPRRMEVVLEDAYILIHEKKISQPARTCSRCSSRSRKRGKPLLDHRRGRRGRSARRPSSSNKLRGTLNVVRRQGAGLRRPPQGHARRHRHPHRRQGASPRTSASSSRTSRSTTSASAKRVVIDKDNTTIVDGAGKTHDIQGRVKQIRAPDRGDHLRLRPREAPGAPGQARRRRRRHQRRRRHRSRDEGEEGPRRRRPPRDPRGRRGGHRRRRRRRPAPHRQKRSTALKLDGRREQSASRSCVARSKHPMRQICANARRGRRRRRRQGARAARATSATTSPPTSTKTSSRPASLIPTKVTRTALPERGFDRWSCS